MARRPRPAGEHETGQTGHQTRPNAGQVGLAETRDTGQLPAVQRHLAARERGFSAVARRSRVSKYRSGKVSQVS